MIDDLGGVMVALVTPLHQDGSFDQQGCRRLIRHVIAKGIHGVLALGSTGEVASLSQSTREEVLRVVIQEVNGRVPVLAGVAQNSLSTACDEVERLAKEGAIAAIVVPPFYSPIDQDTILSFYRGVARNAPIPLMAYNIPAFTKVAVAPRTVATLAREGALAGVKDSSRDYEYLEDLLISTRGIRDFKVFTGTDTTLLGSLVMGSAGVIALSANLAPQFALRIFNATRRNDLNEARIAQDIDFRLITALRTGVFPAGIKAALDLMGLCGGWTAAPIPPLGEEARRRLRIDLTALGVLGEDEQRYA